jgi:hypothetical protein
MTVVRDVIANGMLLQCGVSFFYSSSSSSGGGRG